MKTISHFTISAILLTASLFAQAQDTAVVPGSDPAVQPVQSVEPAATAPVSKRLKINLFATTQFDSLLNLLPNGDSLRQNCQVVGMGIEDSTNHLVVVIFDDQGIPQALTFTPAELNKAASTGTPGPKKPEQTGRTWFIIETTLKSAPTYIAAYNTILSNDTNTNGQVIAGLSLLTIGGMLYGSYAFTKNMELGYGKVALMNYGSTALGNYYPMFLSLFIANATELNEKRWYSRDVYDSTTRMWNYSERPKITDYVQAGTSVIGYPLGIYLGSRLNIANKDDYGKVAVMEYFSQTFSALAFALPVFYYDHPFDTVTTPETRHYLSASTGLAMCMLPAGFYGGYWLTRDKEISAGRGTLPWVTGAMGSLTGLGLAMLGDEYHGIASTRAILGLTIAGYAGGTWLGFNYHPQIDYTFWQSVFIGASAAAGTAVGVSFPLIAEANNHRAYILASIAGGWTGFYFGERLSLQLFEKSSRDKKTSDLRVNLPGLAALPLLFSLPKTEGTFNAQREVPAMPVANLEWRF
jgi:hypothetical protein